jgi:hypothetical protein
METLLPSLKHVSAYYHLYDIYLYNVAHIPVQQYQLHCYMHCLGAFHGILCGLCTCDNTPEKYVTAFHSDVHLQN